MSISEEINAIRDKYKPKHKVYDPSKYCRNALALSLGECQTCGYCGREFDKDGKLLSKEDEDIGQADKEIFAAVKHEEHR